MRRLWQTHRLAMLGFGLGALVTLVFVVRFAFHAVYWMDPAHRDMVPQPWMTVGFVAQSWGLDPVVIDEKAGFPSPGPGKGGPKTLADIAAERGVPVDQIITELNAVLLTLKAEAPAP